MKIGVISCWNYRDAWHPFFSLLDYFWPGHPKAYLLTDQYEDGFLKDSRVPVLHGPQSERWSWGKVLSTFARNFDEPILLFQEDFFLSALVHDEFIKHGLREMNSERAQCVRLHPVPGADEDYGDGYFGFMSDHAQYRISLQAAIWNPRFLAAVAAEKDTAEQFEVIGNREGWYDHKILAFKREVRPWPLEYICSAISKGRWDPNAKKLCDLLGIENDWTRRPFAA